MRIYRLYFLDEDNDVIEARETVHLDDEAAILAAEPLVLDRPARRELWQSANLVKTWA